MRAAAINIDGDQIFVEVIDAEMAEITQDTGQFRSEHVAALKELESTQDAICRTVRGMASTVRRAFDGTLPTEFSLEFNLAFGGDVRPVPFLVSADVKAAVKIKATWKGISAGSSLQVGHTAPASEKLITEPGQLQSQRDG